MMQKVVSYQAAKLSNISRTKPVVVFESLIETVKIFEER
jgi:hypothetical protein